MTSTPQPPQIRSIHRQVPFATARVVAALMLREMSTTSGRNPGGYIWSILEPVAGIALMSWIFISVGFRNPALGTNFAMFYATGLLPFYVFSNVSGKVAQALNYSRPLLAYPRVTVADALIARFVLNMMNQILVAYLVLAGLMIFQDTGTMLDLSHVVLGFVMAGALALGVGLVNCVLFSALPLWHAAWAILNRPLILVSGVMILPESLPSEWEAFLTWNPLVHIVAEVRSGIYHGYQPAYISPAFVFGVSLVLGVVGLLFLWRFHRDMLEA